MQKTWALNIYPISTPIFSAVTATKNIYFPSDAGKNALDEKIRALGYFIHKYGKIDWLESNNEYWLRELHEVKSNGEVTAMFRRPDAVAGQSIVVENQFLYDYYYSGNDANGDQYQQYYSQAERIKENYPYIEAYTPYIVAFPGKKYYEFDMSGQFVPSNTNKEIAKLSPQVVTFVSVDNAVIDVTDNALLDKTTQVDKYSYTGAFINRARSDAYVLNDAGSAFQNETGSIVPFRAYMSTAASGAPGRLHIGNATEEEEQLEDITNRGLTIYGKKNVIYIESSLEYEATVVIYSPSGQMITRVKVQPKSKETVKVPSRGIYIANNRKVTVL